MIVSGAAGPVDAAEPEDTALPPLKPTVEQPDKATAAATNAI
jgi:hypothetical protein